MKVIRAFSLMLLFLPGSIAFSQILNIDRQEDSVNKHPEKRLHALLNFGLDIDQEENRVIDLNSNIDFSWLRNNHMVIYISEFDITSTGSQKIINAGFSHLRFRLNRTGKNVPEIFAQYQ